MNTTIEANKINKTNIKRYSISLYMIVFIFLYALFSLDRVKKMLSLTVDGFRTTNEIWIIFFICFLSYINSKIKRNRKTPNKYSFYLAICLYVLFMVIIIGGFNAVSISQYIYATLLFITPSFLFFISSSLEKKEIYILFKIFIVTCLIYSSFAIILTTNYAFFMGLVGNPIDNYRYYSQYRASMMLGSSITVSYYLNLTLPLCFYLFYNSKEKKWRRIAALSIGVNIIATLILLSRNASLVMFIIVISNVIFINNNNKKNFKKKFTLIGLLTVIGLFTINKYDLSRLTMGLDRIEGRIMASNLGFNIFREYPIFGSGMGRFFERVYEFRYITFHELTGIIDPHNMYIFILSEMGLIGFIVVGILILILIKSFSNIQQKSLRQAAYLTLFCLLLGGIGGSHLINEISFSTIFWIYMGMFNSLSIKDTTRVEV